MKKGVKNGRDMFWMGPMGSANRHIRGLQKKVVYRKTATPNPT